MGAPLAKRKYFCYPLFYRCIHLLSTSHKKSFIIVEKISLSIVIEKKRSDKSSRKFSMKKEIPFDEICLEKNFL
jgi:hypothetical protein